MDWIVGMQKAIDYIENHLTEKIDYDMVAYRRNKITKSSRQRFFCLELFYKHPYEKSR